MSIKEIKAEMLKHKDFHGGDIMYTDDIEKATTKKELADIMNRYAHHLEMVAIDAQAHHDSFKTKLGLNLC